MLPSSHSFWKKKRCIPTPKTLKLYDYKCFYLLNDDFGGKFQNPFSPKLFTEIFGDSIKNPPNICSPKIFAPNIFAFNVCAEINVQDCRIANFHKTVFLSFCFSRFVFLSFLHITSTEKKISKYWISIQTRKQKLCEQNLWPLYQIFYLQT